MTINKQLCEDIPKYKNGKIYLLDRRIGCFTTYTSLPENLSNKSVGEARDYRWVDGYGNGVETTALVLGDIVHLNKLRLVNVLICNSRKESFICYMPVREFARIITRRKCTTKKQ